MKLPWKKGEVESLESVHTHGKFNRKIYVIILFLIAFSVCMGLITGFDNKVSKIEEKQTSLSSKVINEEVKDASKLNLNSEKFATIALTGTTTIDITGLSAGADTGHQHIYEAKYDENQHWQECWICGAETARVNHDKYTEGTYGCAAMYGNQVEKCRGCGWSHVLTKKAHTFTGTWTLAGDRDMHYITCSECGQGTYEPCIDAQGRTLGCSTGIDGVCIVCGQVVNHLKHAYLVDGSCMRCGKKFLTATTTEITAVNETSTRITANVVKTEPGATLTFDVLRYENHEGVPNSTSAISYSENVPGSNYTITGIMTFDKNIVAAITASEIIHFRYQYNGFTNDSYIYNNVKTDNWTPTKNSLSLSGNGVGPSSYSRQAKVTANYTDTYDNNNTIYMRLLDVDKNTVISDWVAASKSGTTYTHTFDVVAEVREPANVYVQVKDACGNTTILDQGAITVQYIDALAPRLTSTAGAEATAWTKTRHVTFQTVDYGVGDVQFGFNNVNEYKMANKNGDTYTREYDFVGDVTGTVKATLYMKDALGNERTVRISLSNIDNTAPTITNVAKSVAANKRSLTLNVESNDYCAKIKANGSGVTGYAMTRDKTTPSNFQGTNSFNVTENGIYYFWTRDLVGNISEPKEILVEEIENTLTVNPNKGTWEGSGNTTTFVVRYQQQRNIENPVRWGYDFTEWTLTGAGSTLVNGVFTMGHADATIVANWTPWKGNVTLTKTDSVTGERLKGAVFGLYEWNGSSYDRKATLTDNQDGTYTIQNITYTDTNQGKFRVSEERQPEHYYAQTWSKDIELVHNNQIINYELTNIPYPRAVITVNKTDNVTNVKLSGAIFGLYEWDGSNYVKRHTLTDRNNGSYVTQLIEYSPTNQGKFKIVEERAPEHYYGYDDRDDKKYRWEKEFVLSDPGYHEYSYDMTNTPYPRSVITVNKTDSVTGEPLDQAIFGLYEWNGSDYNRRATLTDNHDGSYTTSLIEYSATNLGKFKIVEEQAPLYYTNPRKDIEFTLTEPGYHEYSYDIQNEPNKVKVTTVKIDEETKNRIKGAIFTVYEWDVATNNYKEYKRDGQTMTLSFQEDDRTYISEWLYSNRTNLGKFRIVETTAPDGYFGNWNNLQSNEKVNNDIVIDLNNNGQTLTLKNNNSGAYTNKRVKGTINVDKIDSETKRYLAQGDASLDGAVYGLYAAEEIIHKDTVTGKIYDKDQLVDSQTIVNGRLTFDNVEIGNYYIKEIKAPKGYIIDDKKYEINMNYEGEGVEHLTRETTLVEDVKKQAFTIQKLSGNGSSTEPHPLERSGFKIYLIKDLAGVKDGSIVPDENGKYNAEDFLEYDFSNELTALDYSRSQEGERIAELFTDEKGRITSPELAYGQYIIKETTVPTDRYEVSPFIVEIKEDNRTPQNYRYMDDEEFEAYMKINKYDSLTDNKVLNKSAGYRIWNVTEEKYVTYIVQYPKPTEIGTEENPFRINKDGYFTTPFTLQIGEYELREVEAPEGYVKQGYEGKIENGETTNTPKKVVKFKVAANIVYYQDEDLDSLVIEVNQYNDPMLGELKIEKQGEFLTGTTTREDGTIDFNYELKEIEGTEFEVYAKEEILTQDNQGTVLYEKDGLVGTVKTNIDGVGYLDNLPIGKYYIKETKAGEGFTLNKEIKEFEIKYQGEETPVQEVEVDYTNERQKADINDNRGLIIEKITENIVYKPGEEVTYIIKVSNTGENEIKDINVAETKINGAFDDIENENIEKVDDKTIIIKSLKPGESVDLKFRTVIKELDESDDKIKVTNLVKAEGTITIPDPDNPGKTKDEKVEAEGKRDIVVTDKDLVVYKEALKDSYAPGEVAQYLIHVINNGKEEIKNVNVSETMLGGRFVELEESEVKGVKISYKKTEEGEDDLNNVVINQINPNEEVTLKYEYLIPIEAEIDLKLGNNVKVKGTILIPNPDDPDNPTEKEVEDEDNTEITIKEDDDMLGIVKKDSKTGERVGGAVIGIYTKEDIKTADGTVLIEKDTLIEKVVTDNQGKGKFTVDLPLGMYYVQEIEAPEGYLLSTEQIDVDLRYKGQDQETITVSHIISDRRREIRIDKVDEEGKLLVGAELEIVDEEGNTTDTWITENESHIVDKLKKGKVYTLKEINPAKGYTTAKEIKFYIGEDEKLYQLVIEEAENEGQQEQSIMVDYIVMKDTKTKIKIEVKDKETGENVPGIKVDIVDKTTGEVVDTVVTKEDGAEIEGLPIGDYKLRIEDPENRGYVTDKTDITVKDTPEEQKYEIDVDYTKVEVGIKDEETGKLLPGGKIEVLDEEGNVVAEIETEEDMSKLDRLPPGKYTLHETEAPKGYWPSEDIEIEVKDTGERQTFTLTNRRKIFDMSVEKKLIKQVYNGVETNIEGNLSKFEIRPQNIGTAEFWTIYTVTVKNVGEIEGKATVKELVPDGFEMYQESNLAWKVEGNEATLTTDVIKPGESREYEVALRWKQSVLNIGMKENKVALVSTENEFGFKDENEDGNNSSASILVALSTGLDEKVENIIIASLIIAILSIISIILKMHLSYSLKN